MTFNKLLVCGGRNFNDYGKLHNAMLQLPFTPAILIEGGAKGADSLARMWAVQNNVHCAEIRPLWDHFGKRAGVLRNEAMLLLNPNYCLAMPGGRGTDNIVSKCEARNIIVWRPYG